MLTVVEQRLVNRPDLTDNDVVVSVRNDFVAAFENILKLLPDTKTVAVVVGASPLEKFWIDEVKRELKPLEGRLDLVWYSDLPFEEILKRASALPPHSALFWGLMLVDAAGIVHEGDIALHRLHAVANAPIFSYQEAFLRRRQRRRSHALHRRNQFEDRQCRDPHPRRREAGPHQIRADRIWAAEI